MNLTIFSDHIKRYSLVYSFLFISAVAYFPLFYKLDTYGIYMWDEARNAVSAFEMSVNGDYIVRYVDGVMDDWELKPPMLMWLQILFSKMVGFNELAVRLPSALSGFLLLLITIYFTYKFFNTSWIGVLASLILISSSGFVGEHVTRTGDHDALLCFLLAAQIFVFYYYTQVAKDKHYLLMLMSVLAVAAVYTKSIMGTSYIAGMLLFSILNKNFVPLLKNKYTYLSFIVFCGMVAGYYLLRESRQPGYFSLVWEKELFPRYANTNNAFDSGTWYYYLLGFVQYRFFVWIYFLIPCGIFTQMWGTQQQKTFNLYLWCIFISFLLLISSGTKNFWYDAPLYLPMSLIISLGLVTLYKKLAGYRPVFQNSIVVLFLLCFIIGYDYVMQKALALNNVQYGAILYKEYVSLLSKNGIAHEPVKSYHNRYDAARAHLLFYSYTQPAKFSYLKSPQDYKVGDSIVICDRLSGEQLSELFIFDTIHTHKVCAFIRIIDKK